MNEPHSSFTQAAAFMDTGSAAEIATINDTAYRLVITVCISGTKTGESLFGHIAVALTPKMMFNNGLSLPVALAMELLKFIVESSVTLRCTRSMALYITWKTLYI